MQLTSLCWLCANAYGQCSWSREFKAVKDWKAEKTILVQNSGNRQYFVDSYNVKSCPHFKEEKRKK